MLGETTPLLNGGGVVHLVMGAGVVLFKKLLLLQSLASMALLLREIGQDLHRTRRTTKWTA
jgi:hypothetical protein